MIILASGSPRRKQLLKKLTEDFVVVPSTCAEVTTAALPRLAARELACHKAVDVFTHTDCGKQSGAVVIGCDTVVDLDGVVLGKPGTAEEAAEMLRLLSDRIHLVHTGYAVVSQGFVDVGVETTQVTFRKLTDEDVAVYVASGAPMDKAGAYGIQETDFVSGVVGSYDNVIGFPTEQINRLLIACGAVLQK